MTIKNVSIIGLGALGVMYGQYLSKKLPKQNLSIIADQQRIENYQNQGIYCNGERCEFHYVTPEEVVRPADLVIFTVKFNGLREAIEAVRHHVGEQTILISALNGISSEGIIGETYGLDKVLYCVAQGMDAVKVGNKLSYDHMGLLCFGERQPGVISKKMKRLAAFFDEVELPYEIESDMFKRQWGKFMLNVGVNQTVAVHRGNYGDIQKEGPAREMMIAAMRDVIALSEQEGVNLTEEDLTYWLSVLNTLSPEGKPSMAQDVEARRYSEVDLFSGTVITLGEKYGLPTPINHELYDRIKLMESDYEVSMNH
ncbi:2-dehydropantoate 2-reductase [Pullulanibacillus pueri]|uniref:2-dehydropantoate 2-reductase n=1 Tax=Pullulanibacillus pueri TaxID=1437324 RepID=A0A8J2ZVV7_9BACL|nr:ketopantoate reductase family protein [Pullulanibacillus pueri]MBM7680930.1 2-dehydropantoate 2-reductase [Pullulanibacillus pueri]GGH81378.1 2-dehydropantoate 2-reductase [Pullulanibacillus pueri]